MTSPNIQDNPQFTQVVAGAGQTVFTFTFNIQAQNQMLVYQLPAVDVSDPVDATYLLSYGTDYTVPFSSVNTVSGGTITLNVPAAANDIITMVGNPALELPAYLPEVTTSAISVNSDFNLLLVAIQALNTALGRRALLYPDCGVLINPNENIIPQLPVGYGWVGGPSNTIVTQLLTGFAPNSAKYILQQPNAALTNAQSLSALSSGILKSASGTGVVSIAVPGTDYVIPSFLGTMATQNANNVNITGGSITGVTGVVSSITAGTGLSGGTITSTGTIAIANTGVTANTYIYPTSVTVNAQGQLTAISGGSIPAPGNSTVQPITQTAHGFSVGNVLYFNGTSYVKANASAASTAEVIGIVSAVANANSFTLLMEGWISTLSGLIAGDTYFLSDVTSGLLTTTEPTTTGHISKPLLVATSSTTGVMTNMRGKIIPNPSSVSGNSTVQDITQNAHGFSVGNVLYFNGTVYALAKADTVTTAEVVGIVSAVANVNNFTLLMEGWLSTLTGLTAGSTYFLSDAVAGLLTTTEPTATGHISKPLIIAVSTTGAIMTNMRGKIIPGPTVAFGWSIITTDTVLQSNFGYYINANALNLTLPASFSSTDEIKIRGLNNNSWILNVNAGQSITYATLSTSASGSVSSTDPDDMSLNSQIFDITALSNTQFVVDNFDRSPNFQ
jgi:hypothetical protein